MLSLSSLSAKLIKNYWTTRFLQPYRNIMDSAFMLTTVKKCIPSLDNNNHKGQAGRIGVVGGSLEYTGAPYFAGISALKVGADLVHIFCAAMAANVIKSYSPELIVHPLLDQPNAVREISPWLDRLHALVIGPGLGRDTNTLEVVSELITIIREKKIPLIIDADGLFLITKRTELLKDFTSPVVLTPNKIEFQRLCEANGAADLNNFGENVVILKKGPTDELLSTNTDVQWQSDIAGSGRRCGGQGDLLSGSLATFLNWTLVNIDTVEIDAKTNKNLVATSLASFAASSLVRLCNAKAFKLAGRSMLASDMIEQIHNAFEDFYGDN